jgi:hypothetical protein
VQAFLHSDMQHLIGRESLHSPTYYSHSPTPSFFLHYSLSAYSWLLISSFLLVYPVVCRWLWGIWVWSVCSCSFCTQEDQEVQGDRYSRPVHIYPGCVLVIFSFLGFFFFFSVVLCCLIQQLIIFLLSFSRCVPTFAVWDVVFTHFNYFF